MYKSLLRYLNCIGGGLLFAIFCFLVCEDGIDKQRYAPFFSKSLLLSNCRHEAPFFLPPAAHVLSFTLFHCASELQVVQLHNPPLYTHPIPSVGTRNVMKSTLS